VLSNFGHGGAMAETGNGFPTCCHKAMAKWVFRGDPWRPLFAWRLAMVE